MSTSSVSGVDGKFWEFLKYVYPTNHAWSCQIVTVNNDTWKKLSPAQQKAIEELAKKLEPEFWAASLKADTDSLKRLNDGGMEVVHDPARHDDGLPAPRPRRCSTRSSSACRRPRSR